MDLESSLWTGFRSPVSLNAIGFWVFWEFFGFLFFQVFCLFCVNFGKLVIFSQEICLFHLSCQICWYKGMYNIFIIVLVSLGQKNREKSIKQNADSLKKINKVDKLDQERMRERE